MLPRLQIPRQHFWLPTISLVISVIICDSLQSRGVLTCDCISTELFWWLFLPSNNVFEEKIMVIVIIIKAIIIVIIIIIVPLGPKFFWCIVQSKISCAAIAKCLKLEVIKFYVQLPLQLTVFISVAIWGEIVSLINCTTASDHSKPALDTYVIFHLWCLQSSSTCLQFWSELWQYIAAHKPYSFSYKAILICVWQI